MRTSLSGAGLLGLLLVAAGAEAQQPPASQETTVARDATTGLTTRLGRPFSPLTTSIVGWARAADNTPIPGAAIRLRSAETGRVEATAVSSADGEFSFVDVEGGTYVLELLDERGRIVAVSPIFSISAGEAMATILRVASRQPFLASFFGNAASAVISSAAGVGVTAVAPQGERRSASPDDIP